MRGLDEEHCDRGADAIAPLEVDGLTKSFGETRALVDVTLRFEAGTVHAVLGENGSGKSTLVKLLSGIVAPSRGSVRIGGVVPARAKPTIVQALSVQTVFQEVLIAPDRSVVDNVLLGADGLFRRRIRRGDRRGMAAAALGAVSVGTIPLDAELGRLPLAIQQSVVLARALVRSPRVLILDEATAALDYADRDTVFATIERFARSGGLVVFISHRMDEVSRLADAVTVLRGGRLVATLGREDAEPERLLRLMAPETAGDRRVSA